MRACLLKDERTTVGDAAICSEYLIAKAFFGSKVKKIMYFVYEAMNFALSKKINDLF